MQLSKDRQSCETETKVNIHVTIFIRPARCTIDKGVPAEVVAIAQALDYHKKVEYKAVPLTMIEFFTFDLYILLLVH